VTLETEEDLVGLAAALAAGDLSGTTAEEQMLLDRGCRPASSVVQVARDQLAAGMDPLGDAFTRLRSPRMRRSMGATFTPLRLVDSMLVRAARFSRPTRVVDPGAGSGRFLVGAARAFPEAELVGVEIDPLAALLCRSNLAAAGLAHRATVLVTDFRGLELAPSAGQTLFVGNPPYIRHHDIEPKWKAWLKVTSEARGLRASQLAGSHIHFLLKTAEIGHEGDVGVYITSAEWLDVNYGHLARKLLADSLGLLELDVLEPTALAFPDAAATAVVASFRIGDGSQHAWLRRAASVDDLQRNTRSGRHVPRTVLADASRWSTLTRRPRSTPAGFIELGEICRVSRGQVTGANSVWIAAEGMPPLPRRFLVATVTKARELFHAGSVLSSVSGLRSVIDLPEDLDPLDDVERELVNRFLRYARNGGAHEGYIARHRKAWWSVGLYPPAPILATYMARRPPAFVRNPIQVRHINIAHGLYPRVALPPEWLDALARHLTRSASTRDGRTYAGGLTKFEPKEMERLLVPAPEALQDAA
jgi:hypothetical protein